MVVDNPLISTEYPQDYPQIILLYNIYIYIIYIIIFLEHFMVGGLEHFLFSHSVGNNHPNWLSCFSEGLKPPTSQDYPQILLLYNIYIYIYIYT